MNVYQWLCVVGIPSLVGLIWTTVINRQMKARDERQREIKEQNDKIEEQNKAVMAGVQALLRDRLVQSYRYYINKGFADYEDRKNLENIWKQYHALGQNGAMDDLRSAFRALPVYQGNNEVDVSEEE